MDSGSEIGLGEGDALGREMGLGKRWVGKEMGFWKGGGFGAIDGFADGNGFGYGDG